MSNARFSILQAKAVKDKRISDSQFRTLAALGMYGDENGWCFPALATIGKDLSKTKQAVGRDTIALRKLGYLEVYHRYDKKTGGRRSNLYRLKYDLPSQPDDDGVSTDKVDGVSTSEVDVNVPSNAPSNALENSKIKMPLEWKLTHDEKVTDEDVQDARIKDQAPKMFEKAFGFGKLPWYSNKDWTAFAKFVIDIYKRDQLAFGNYIVWRAGDGKYTGMSNKQIRMNPKIFMDTGWLDFESPVDAAPKPAINAAAVESTKQMIAQKDAQQYAPPPSTRPQIKQVVKGLTR